MSNRSLLILALVALAFCTYLYFRGGDPGTLQKEQEAGRLVILDPADIQRIELTNPGGTFVFQKAGPNKWNLEKPIKFSADPSMVAALLSELEVNEKQRVILPSEIKDYQAALEQFGLKDPRISARFQTDKEVVDLQVGGKTPSGNLFYAIIRDPKKQQLAVIDEVIESQLTQNLDLWRNSQIFDFSDDQATGLLLRKGGQEVEVVKEGDGWNITKPLKEIAVPDKIKGFLSEVAALRANNFVSETGSDPVQYGLNTPSFTLEVKLGDRSEILRVGKAVPDKPDLVYAQFGDRPAVFTLPVKLAEGVGMLLEIIRPRALFNLSAETVPHKIEIMRGNSVVVLQRKEGGSEDDWVVQGEGMERRANPLGVSDMIQAMTVIRAKNFFSSVDNPNADYGLQKPAAGVTVSGYDSTRTDKTFQRKVLFGAVNENSIYAQSSELPFVVDIDRRFIEAFPKGVTGWFDPALGLPAADQVTGLVWTQGALALSLEKSAEGKWASVPPGKVIDGKFLDMQLSFLAALKVQRWVGKAAKKDFAKPRFVLEIKAGETSRQLLFGPKQADGGTLAKMADDEQAFLLSAEDVKKLVVPPIPGEAMIFTP